MTPLDKPDGPTFRDLYEIQTKIDAKLDKNTDRLSRLEKGFLVLLLLMGVQKAGGPDPAKLVALATGFFT